MKRLVFYVSVEPSEVTNQVVGDYVMDIVSVDPGNLILCCLIHFVQPVLVVQLLSNVYQVVICCHALVFCKVDDCCIVNAVISYPLDRA